MFKIADREIGVGQPAWIIAELSANCPSLDIAIEAVRAAKQAGAEAIKTQAYSPSSMTIFCDKPVFQINSGPWVGQSLWELYKQAAMPREWHLPLKLLADDLGMIYFSTAFAPDDVQFLEALGVPCHKIASFELTDIPLISMAASHGKPIILSAGMATYREIYRAYHTCVHDCKNEQVALLKCTSGYPAPLEELHLRTIADLLDPEWYQESNVIPTVGLSDHTLSTTTPMLAVALGASIIEKHFTLSRSIRTPDSAFSLEPHEFKAMVDAVRMAEQAIGGVHYGPTRSETTQLPFRRSLFIVRNVKVGETFTAENVRSIRPGYGIEPYHYDYVLSRRARRDIERGTPLSWDMID